jgi:hypothetical protein
MARKLGTWVTLFGLGLRPNQNHSERKKMLMQRYRVKFCGFILHTCSSTKSPCRRFDCG